MFAHQGAHHSHDVVMGEVADDDVFDAIELYETGIINREELGRRLRTKRINDQMCLCSLQALEFLTFVDNY